MTAAPSRGWLTAAIIASIALVVSAPMVGQISAWMRDIARGQYVLTLGVLVATAAIAAIGLAAVSIRERRRQRYAWILAALALAFSYGFAARSGVADADAAERFHFIEYGALAVLFYKAWRPTNDGGVVLMPMAAGLLVGTLEEWVQWFVPGRVGEAKDVVLNLFSLGAGVLFALGLDPPSRLTLDLTRSRRAVATTAAAAALVFAGFFHAVHLGHEIADSAGVFRSRYSADELLTVSASRAAEWIARPPLTWSRYSREDQYLTEGIAHVRRRNAQWDEGNLIAARHENLILEKYYAPVLDTPSYIASTRHRWPAEQRARAEAAAGPGFMIYESDALTYPVVTWPPTLYWLLVIVAILLSLRRML